MQARPDDGGRRYDVFISYSHPQRDVAVAVERQLKRIGKPWYRRPQIRVFRDDSVLAAGADLWAPIEQGLAVSRHLLAVASPAAAASPWVEREVRWWLDNRRVDTLLIAVAEGSIEWSTGTRGFAPDQTTCLVPSLYRAFAAEPHWVDLREVAVDEPSLMPACAGISAAITGRTKDEVLSEDRRQHRRTRRTVAAALALITCLAIVAVIAGISAISERNRAQDSARVASARAFLANAAANSGDDLQSAFLDAAASQRLDNDQRATSGLLGTLSAQPRLHRFITEPFTPTAITWAKDRDLLIQGGGDQVQLTDVDGPTSRVIDVGHTVTSLASDDAGTTAAVGLSDGRMTLLNVATGRITWSVRTRLPRIAAIAVGYGDVAAVSSQGALEVRAMTSGRLLWHGNYQPDFGTPGISYVEVLSDGSAVLAGTELGETAVVSSSAGQRGPWSTSQVADTVPPSSYIDSGGALTFAFPFPDGMQVRTLRGPRVSRSFPVIGYGDAWAYAMSADRNYVALAADGKVSLVSADDPTNPTGTIIALTGVTAEFDTLLGFSADGAYLASTNGSTTAIWSIRAASGLATTIPRYLPGPCRACGNSSAVLDNQAGTLLFEEYDARFGTPKLVCWDVKTHQVRATATSSDISPGQVLLLAEHGSELVTATEGTGAVEWRVHSGCPAGSPQALPLTGLSRSEQQSFSPALVLRDGSIVGTLDNGQLVWRTAASTTTLLPDVRVTNFPSTIIATSPDHSNFVAALRTPGRVAQFELTADNELRRTWTAQLARPVSSAVYASNDTIALATDRGVVSLWSASIGRKVATLSGANGFELAATSDGAYLVGVTGHQTDAAVWSLKTDSLATTFDFAPLALSANSPLRYASAAAQLATVTLSDAHHGIWFFLEGIEPTRWNLDDHEFRHLACAEAGTSLTRRQWTEVTGTTPPNSTSCTAN